MTTTAKLSARVFALPGAAPEPVRQHARRGRFPAKVAPIGRGRLIRLMAGTSAATAPSKGEGKGHDAGKALEDAERFYLTCKHVHDVALSELLEARRRAGLEVKPCPLLVFSTAVQAPGTA